MELLGRAWGEGRKICMKVYAFDVDETLYLSHGPVQREVLVALRAEGHVLGLCGNWARSRCKYPNGIGCCPLLGLA